MTLGVIACCSKCDRPYDDALVPVATYDALVEDFAKQRSIAVALSDDLVLAHDRVRELEANIASQKADFATPLADYDKLYDERGGGHG